jgi:hypothetical protein
MDQYAAGRRRVVLQEPTRPLLHGTCSWQCRGGGLRLHLTSNAIAYCDPTTTILAAIAGVMPVA